MVITFYWGGGVLNTLVLLVKESRLFYRVMRLSAFGIIELLVIIMILVCLSCLISILKYLI